MQLKYIVTTAWIACWRYVHPTHYLITLLEFLLINVQNGKANDTQKLQLLISSQPITQKSIIVNKHIYVYCFSFYVTTAKLVQYTYILATYIDILSQSLLKPFKNVYIILNILGYHNSILNLSHKTSIHTYTSHNVY